MIKPPPNIAAEVKEDKQIDAMACLEAEMTFLKSQDGDPAAKLVYLYPEYLKTLEDIFNFGIYYGRWLGALEAGLVEVSPATREMYNKGKASTN